jgi:transposase
MGVNVFSSGGRVPIQHPTKITPMHTYLLLQCASHHGWLSSDKSIWKFRLIHEVDACSGLNLFIYSWTFAPPYGPEMNGTAKAFVKLAKHRLNQTLKTTKFTGDQLRTTLEMIINSVNSRPIAYLTSEVGESVALYINRILKAGIRPTGGLLDDKQEVGGRYTKQFNAVKGVLLEFWTRWRQEVVTKLISYDKWRQWKKNVQVGQLVMVFDPASKQNDWPMGVIKEIIRGEDGAVRRVIV